MIKTFKYIFEEIYKIEKECNLFKININGIYIWKLIRFQCSLMVIDKLGLYSHNIKQSGNNETTFKSKTDILKESIYSLIYGVYNKNRKVDNIFLANPVNLQLINNEQEDKILFYIFNYFIKNNIKFEIILDNMESLKKYSKYDRISYINKKSKLNIFKKITNKLCLKQKNANMINFFSENDLIVLLEIRNEFYKSFGIDIDIISITKTFIKRFIKLKNTYSEIFRIRKPKRLFIICSYGREGIIEACHESNVECIELQHGVMGYYHLGYHFPSNDIVPYFPDQIYLFGQYWVDATSLPIPKENIKIMGYPFLNYNIDKVDSNTKIKDQVLFIGGVGGFEYSKIILDFAKKNNSLKIVIKIHPIDFNSWKVNDDYLIMLNEMPNVKIIENQKNIYELLLTSEFVIGVNSTVLFEAIAADCNIIILKLPGHEYMDYLIENNMVKTACTVSEITDIINNKYKSNVLDHNYFFKKEISLDFF